MRDGLRPFSVRDNASLPTRADTMRLRLTLRLEPGRDIVECHILRACANELCAIVLVGASLFEGQGGKTPTYLRQELI